MASKYIIRAVVFRSGDHYVAQCLEHDIATQAKTIKALMYEVERILVAHVMMSTGKDHLFDDIPSAPRRFWELYEEAAADLKPVKPAKFPTLPPEQRPHLMLRAA